MMNPEVKALWLDALRSGEYEQGQNFLHSEKDGKHTYCCLGVLCDLAVKAGVLSETVSMEYVDPDGDEDITTLHGYGHETGVLPKVVQKWAGLDGGTAWRVDADGEYRSFEAGNGKVFTTLSQLNDGLPVDGFTTVANVIEWLY